MRMPPPSFGIYSLLSRRFFLDFGKTAFAESSLEMIPNKQTVDSKPIKVLSIIGQAVVLLVSTFCLAGEFEDGLTAFNRGDYQAALTVWTIGAKKGDAASQYNLAVMYANGEAVPKDYKQAALWYRKAADQRNGSAQYNLGLLYANGQGVKQDYNEARLWYGKAAAQGITHAQYALGLLYANAQGVQQDYKQAALWYRKAADRGNRSAQNALGLLYANGQGLKQDYSQAALWFRNAANLGMTDAQYNLGVMYVNGQGVKQDYIEAYKWFAIAEAHTSNAEPDLRNAREEAAKQMTAAQISEAQKRASEWSKK